jgi:hypothetical protein
LRNSGNGFSLVNKGIIKHVILDKKR